MVRFWIALFLFAAIATAAVGLSAKLWYDQAALARHGMTATATIVEINCGRSGCTALVAFTVPTAARVGLVTRCRCATTPPIPRTASPGGR